MQHAKSLFCTNEDISYSKFVNRYSKSNRVALLIDEIKKKGLGDTAGNAGVS